VRGVWYARGTRNDTLEIHKALVWPLTGQWNRAYYRLMCLLTLFCDPNRTIACSIHPWAQTQPSYSCCAAALFSPLLTLLFQRDSINEETRTRKLPSFFGLRCYELVNNEALLPLTRRRKKRPILWIEAPINTDSALETTQSLWSLCVWYGRTRQTLYLKLCRIRFWVWASYLYGQ